MSESFIIPAAVIGTGLSFAFSVFTNIKYQQSKETMKKIEIPNFKPDYHLRREVQKSANKRMYVAVEGKVEPLAEALKSKFVPGCYGVIQKVTSREQQDPKPAEVPFRLVAENTDVSNVWVRVKSPLEAKGDYLQEVHRGVEQMDNDGSTSASGQKMREEMLCVKSVITGIGDVVMEQGSDERMVLECPIDGREFFLFSGGYDSVKKRHKQKCMSLKVMSITGALTGCSILGTLIYNTLKTEEKRK
ncbi:mitochondrial ubiquitin ligase activator of nfkb 1-A isoform X2 [Pangasianodon hypophthalmus]|nr:mitochondrial ubiquitin ligase activator of nfkb 1-A isoform X2 [Pangasianodon hypophthalmus]